MEKPCVYVTLLTRLEYLPGVLVLEHTLRATGSKFPLVVMVTSALSQEAKDILRRRQIRTENIESLLPPKGRHALASHDSRFADTWTKLRAFGLTKYRRVVLLDADMIIMRNMDELMELVLSSGNIAACHVCACNPRKLAHYPSDWIPENCAYTPLVHPSCLTSPPVITPSSPRPYTQLNSGLVVLEPSLELANSIYNHLATSPNIHTWTFPDQDLLSDFFQGSWTPLPWCYNALKTLMVIHSALWRDEEIRCLHYILADKPWKARVPPGGTGSVYDKVHRWWWDRFVGLREEMQTSQEDWALVWANVAPA
ncbi:glycosyltransferase family 8 protein [Coniophora puteana RWD-64-598 SS2]|uniref:Glycosyltransferase family 8 protein n=1 Tax=Coniophora puteana (strain RWD-64-598) TaxID=741705 RepID=A0A5M3N6X1_CONPW|nr:glycosyltransferase family 8 protein [Coniophora puteana RWD-64-598 SS2]EIW86601.1 glycosyltransferase family 8 protein [Coniophora puteana RWD-64-598 SS2]